MNEDGNLKQAVWLALAPLSIILVALIAIIALIMYIIHKSYRPIDNIVRRAASCPLAEEAAGNDEFSFIESAFDSMMNQIGLMNEHESQRLMLKRKQLFIGL